jgi:hypothetical protein
LHEPLTWEKQQDAVERFKAHFHEIYNSASVRTSLFHIFSS